jgi:hypothetical protein
MIYPHLQIRAMCSSSHYFVSVSTLVAFALADKGCTESADAVFLSISTVDYFVKRGSPVFVAALEISEAFDGANIPDHEKLLVSSPDAAYSVVCRKCVERLV